jgi:hypothetical protein
MQNQKEPFSTGRRKGLEAVFRIRKFLGFPDPLVRDMDPD